MRPHKRGWPHLLLLSMLAISCDLSTRLPVSPTEPTASPGMVDTLAAMTAEAGSTQTSLVSAPSGTATWTPPPSHTPSLTPTLTPTFLFSLTTPTSTAEAATDTPIPTRTGKADLDCRVISQSMNNGHHFNPKDTFEMGWKVRNNGTSDWVPGVIDFAYYSGTKMYVYSPVPLPTSVAAGDTIALGASMIAPRNSGSYTTVWTLRSGAEDFCHVTVRINVP